MIKLGQNDIIMGAGFPRFFTVFFSENNVLLKETSINNCFSIKLVYIFQICFQKKSERKNEIFIFSFQN
jgi:hypothetical protein